MTATVDAELLTQLQQTVGMHCILVNSGTEKTALKNFTSAYKYQESLGWEYLTQGFLDKPYKNKWVNIFAFKTPFRELGVELFWYDKTSENYWLAYTCSETGNKNAASLGNLTHF